jgi:hypothetical protein
LPCTKEKAEMILQKVVKCKNCKIVSLKMSNFKGYHIEMYCAKNCDDCRLIFDDYRRYAEDRKRLTEFTNLIFDVKHGF